MNISQIISDLSNITEVLEKYIRYGSISIAEERSIVDFFIAYHGTNEMVSYALDGIQNEAERTMDEFTELLHSTESFLAFYSSNEQRLSMIDFKADSEKYLKPFWDAYECASAEANGVWKRIQELSNSLDYMWETDERYPAYRKECDEKEEQYYNVLKPRVDTLFKKYKEEETNIAPVFYFTLEMFVTIIMKVKDIADSVIADINTIRKGGEA